MIGQLIHSNPLSSTNNTFKLGNKISLENIIFVNKSINRKVSLIGLHFQKICINLLVYNIPTFRTQKYGGFSTKVNTIYSWNSINDLLSKNLSLKKGFKKDNIS